MNTVENIFNELTQIRKQLVIQQTSINECLATIDELITRQLNAHPNVDNDSSNIPNNYSNIGKKFPKNILSKRDKLRHILSEANEPMTAKEIKMELLAYGEILANVDQSLVNLEKDRLIFSHNENGRKRYFLKK